MTRFEKVVSVTLATIVFIMACMFMLTLGGVIDPSWGSNVMEKIVEGDFWSKIFLVVALVLLVFSIKEIAFGQKVESEGREGIILENESGKLIISKESLENLISGVGRDIVGAESITSRTFIDQEKNVTVNVNIVISREVVIKDISSELQKRIKVALKQTADLDVKYVNIKIKNISNKKSKKTEEKTPEVKKNI